MASNAGQTAEAEARTAIEIAARPAPGVQRNPIAENLTAHAAEDQGVQGGMAVENKQD